ncbi:hypothetical protein SHIRM173S_04457 [Streptomyces hirsutus]
MTGSSPPVAGADTPTWRSSPRSGAGRATGLADTTVVGASAAFRAFASFELFELFEADMEMPSLF